jgi:hypothetical protein
MSMSLQENSLRSQIALGWVLMLLIMTIMLAFMIVQSSFMNNNFASLRDDPGQAGLDWIVYVLAVYILMPIYINVTAGWRHPLFKYLPVVAAALILAYFIVHHTSHWYAGDRPTFSSNVLDVLHHVVTLWVLVNSIRLAANPAFAAA